MPSTEHHATTSTTSAATAVALTHLNILGAPASGAQAAFPSRAASHTCQAAHAPNTGKAAAPHTAHAAMCSSSGYTSAAGSSMLGDVADDDPLSGLGAWDLGPLLPPPKFEMDGESNGEYTPSLPVQE